MCGIVGIVGVKPTPERMISALYRLEYRGYDSAGIATVEGGQLDVRKTVGKIKNLEEEVKGNPLTGFTGIGHTRWATHGAPATRNAHPMRSQDIGVVHNGIIENHHELRAKLIKEGYQFTSDTDTEVIPCLISSLLAKGYSELEAAKEAAKMLEGAFALAIIFASNDNLMIGMKKGSPLAIGVGEGEMFIGSDALALSPFTNKVVYLEDNDIAVLNRDDYKVFDKEGKEQQRQLKVIAMDAADVGKNGYAHFMYKEISEQPEVISRVFNHYYDSAQEQFKFAQLSVNLAQVERIYIIACGTSYFAASIAKYWFERYAKIPVEIDIASEFRYRSPIIAKNSLAIFISQSGETADTLWALKNIKQGESYNISLVNVSESSIAREADAVLPVCAGYEIGVASTKSFTAQLMVMGLLNLYMCQERKTLAPERIKEYVQQFHSLIQGSQDVLKLDKQIMEISREILNAKSMIYVGRDLSYPLAMEGALKMKELSYIHAEGIAAGELKHGPIALLEEGLPVIAIAPNDELFAKTVSNIHEIKTRKGKIITLTDEIGSKELEDISHAVITLPPSSNFTSPILYVIALQLLSYHTAHGLGHDVDQPRNLAKSVTVE
jgi:glucosamine--fructose-6-phosphate aminotransferase (isomerizing)